MTTFSGNNSQKARNMLIERSIYTAYALTLLDGVGKPTIETLQIKDFQKDEKLLIGRVDRNFNPIFVDPAYLKSFGSSKMALGFVVEAFKVVKKKYDRALRTGRVSMGSPVLSELVAKKAYIEPMGQYISHINKKAGEFKRYVKRTRQLKKITNFDTFVPVFMEFVELTAQNRPFTKSMYFLTKDVSPLVSGMAIEIAVGDYGDDRYKTENFYKDKNFEYLKNLAYAHGFVIDKHIPWRLVADLNSPQMQPYIESAFGVEGGSAIVLSTAFTQTYSDDVPGIIDMMVNIYNTIARHRPRTVVKEPTATTSPDSGKTIFAACKRKNTIIRRPTTREAMEASHSDGFWLEKYIRIRNLETGMRYNEATLRNISENATDLVNSLDRASAMRYIISKFDNVEHFEGSLFYDITRLDFAKSGKGKESDIDETVKRSVQASNFVIY
jgi:hypothetical protein